MKHIKKILLLSLLTGTTCMTILIAGTFYSLYRNVKAICVESRREFPGDSVESLIDTVKSEALPFKRRNDAIWALGQLADPKALPYLTEIQPKTFCQKPCGNRYLCRYELDKAIKWCTKGNVTSWMYANREEWTS